VTSRISPRALLDTSIVTNTPSFRLAAMTRRELG
jgi:hypothetical protein